MIAAHRAGNAVIFYFSGHGGGAGLRGADFENCRPFDADPTTRNIHRTKSLATGSVT